MANEQGTVTALSDARGIFLPGGQNHKIYGICIKSALTGTLTIVGVVQADGTDAAWVIPSTTVGYVAPPGAGITGGQALSFTYSNPGADAGKALSMTRFA
jgi:hypothetical protein